MRRVFTSTLLLLFFSQETFATSDVEQEFIKFLAKYQRSYASKNEHEKRFKVF